MFKYPSHLPVLLPAILAGLVLFLAPDLRAQAPAEPDAPPPAEDASPETLEERAAAIRAEQEERRRREEDRRRLQPAIDAIAESNPTSPVELMSAVNSMILLDQPEEAKKYIARLLALRLNDEAYYVLQRRVGSGILFKLSGDKRFHPEGQQLADAMLNAAYKQSRDPRRLAQLVRDVNNPSQDVRLAALADLKAAEIDGVLAMIAALADAGRAAEHEKIRHGLYHMGEAAVEPLIGMLGASSEDLRIQAIEVLGLLKARHAGPHLIHPLYSQRSSNTLKLAAAHALKRIYGGVPTEEVGRRLLAQRIDDLSSGDVPRRVNPEGNIVLWLWHPEQNRPIPVEHQASDAALVVAAQLAADLYDLAPDSPDNRRRYLLAILESGKLLAGLDRSLPAGEGTPRRLAARAGSDAVEEVLVEAMRDGRVAAAIAAVEVLGDIGTPKLLLSDDGRERPLVDALAHGNRRLRFAAAEAIIKMDVPHDYPGASRLPETLGYLAASAGLRRVLIGHPKTSDAQTLVGMLAEMGVEADTATTGRALFHQAAAHPDYEMLLISDALGDPPLDELLQELRRDRRTAGLPVGVMAREERIAQLRLRAEADRLTEVFPRPHDPAAMEFQLARLHELSGRHHISDEERVRHASAALAWLTRLAEKPQAYGFYDLLRVVPQIEYALFHGPLPERAAQLLGQLGSERAQEALVDFASQNARPLADRQAAADAFRAAVAKRGLMLREADIDRQYARYNQSEVLEAGTQQVLGQLLDTIEAHLLAASGIKPADDQQP